MLPYSPQLSPIKIRSTLSTAYVRELLQAVLPLPQLAPERARDVVAAHLANRARSTASRLRTQHFREDSGESNNVMRPAPGRIRPRVPTSPDRTAGLVSAKKLYLKMPVAIHVAGDVLRFDHGPVAEYCTQMPEVG
jgi:hypothetical protein